MAQVTYLAGSPITQAGPVPQHTAGVPAVLDGESQVITLATTASGTPTLSGTGWLVLVSSDADAVPGRLWTFWRPGPQAAATITIGYGGANAVTLGAGYGTTGQPRAWARNGATQSTSSAAIPANPTAATDLETLTVSAICNGTWPRRYDSAKPPGMSDIRYAWSYTPAGGIGIGVCYATTNSVNAAYRPGAWTAAHPPDDPPGALDDYWRQQTIVFAPVVTVVTPEDPVVTISAKSSWCPAPTIGGNATSATAIEVGWNTGDFVATGFEAFISPLGSTERTNPRIAAPGSSGLVEFGGLIPGTEYIVSVRTLRAAGSGYTVDAVSAMTETQIRTLGATAAVPQNVQVSVTGLRTATVTWQMQTIPGVTTQVWLSGDGSMMDMLGTVPPGVLAYNLTGLVPGKTYIVQLRTMSGEITGGHAAPVTFVMPAEPTDPTDPGTPGAPDVMPVSDRVKRNLRLMHHH